MAKENPLKHLFFKEDLFVIFVLLQYVEDVSSYKSDGKIRCSYTDLHFLYVAS